LYSKPISASNPICIQTKQIKHSSISSKKSTSSQNNFENLQASPSVPFDENSDSQKSTEIDESKSSDNDSQNQFLNDYTIDHCSGNGKTL